MIRLGPIVITSPGELCEQVDTAIRLHHSLHVERQEAVIRTQAKIILAADRELAGLRRQVELLTSAACKAAVDEGIRKSQGGHPAGGDR